MRAFIAIELPKEIKEHLQHVQAKLASAQADVKWVEPDNIHLTLKFLGETDDATKDKLCLTLDRIAQATPGFAAEISSLGAFPRIQSPRVIWAGIEQGDMQVKEIVGRVEEQCAPLGIAAEEKPFSSHITLGRTRSGKNMKQLIDLLAHLSQTALNPALGLRIEKLTLFQSTLTPHGPIYKAIHEAYLKK